VRIRRAVYERAAAAAFARPPGLIAELLSPASSLSCDVGWCRHCEKNLGLSGFFDPQYSEFRRYWRFSLHTPSAGQGLDSSVDFATRFSRRPRALAAVVLPPHDGEALVGVRSFEDPRHDDLVELLVRLGDVRRDYGLLAIPQQLTRPVAEYLVGTEAEVFSGTAPGVVGRHMLRAKVAVGLHKALEDELSARQSRRGITYGAVEVREQRDAIVGRPSGGFGELVWWWAEGALQSDSDDTALSAARWLAAVTVAAFDDLNWRRRRRVSVMLEQVIGSIGASIQEALSDGQEEPIGHLLEGLALLRVLLRHKGGAIYRWVIPNLRCKNTRTGQDDAEQDIVQVSLCAGGQVRVYMWGCGTGQDLAAKKKADIAKALSLADRIRTRFPHVTRSAVNYFEVADGQVVEDFEGHAAAVFPAT